MPALISLLNVDHDDAQRAAFSCALIDQGLVVNEVATGRAALQFCKVEPPAVMLVELNLPDLEAFELCRRIKSDSFTRQIQVVCFSAALADGQLMIRGYENGADACVVRPAAPEVVVAVIESLMRRANVESRLRKSEDRFLGLLDSGIGILVCQEERIIDANDAFLRALGHTRLDLQHGNLNWRLDDETRRQLMETGKRSPYETDYRRSDGYFTPVMIGAARLYPAPELQWISFVLDLTVRRQMEQHRLLTEKLKIFGRLTRAVGERLNCTTMGVVSNLRLALECSGDNSDSRAFIRAAIEATNRNTHLSKDLLGYGGRPRFVVEPVDVSELVQGVEGLIRVSLLEQIQLVLQLQAELPSVQADAGQIQDLLLSLLTNAAEAIGAEGGTITIRTTARYIDERTIGDFVSYEALQPGEYVCLQVMDSGCGMDEGVKTKIFDPLFSTKEFGRGWGLTTVLGILRSHKGGIYTATTPGRGSSFTVCLPIG